MAIMTHDNHRKLNLFLPQNVSILLDLWPYASSGRHYIIILVALVICYFCDLLKTGFTQCQGRISRPSSPGVWITKKKQYCNPWPHPKQWLILLICRWWYYDHQRNRSADSIHLKIIFKKYWWRRYEIFCRYSTLYTRQVLYKFNVLILQNGVLYQQAMNSIS